jgi:hypothetical protein
MMRRRNGFAIALYSAVVASRRSPYRVCLGLPCTT